MQTRWTANVLEALTARVVGRLCASVKPFREWLRVPELRTYNCKQCGVTVTEAEEAKERRDS